MQTILVALEMLKITIMESSLAVLEQPPQIIKKKLAFNSSVKFLGGNKFVRITSPVTTIVLKEFQAAKLFVEKRAPEISAGCGKVANNIAGKNMINQPASTNVTFQFEKLSLSCLRPKEKNEDTDSEEMEESDETASESGPQEKSDKEPKVMEEKYCLVYITEIQIDNVTYTVWCVSIPFVYQVHTNQTVEGLGTIFWDKYFREPGRIPFVVPDKVSWSKMRPALNDHFKMMTKSQRDFSEINLRNLGTHIFQSTDFTDSSEISFSQFFEKDEVSKHGKWGWFQACVDLTNKHLTPYWQNGHIVGFVDRGEAEHLLRAHKPGDFIVRFSNSVEGGVSVTVFKPRGNDPGTSRGSPELEVENSMPFTTGDLDHLGKLKATINISDLIRTYHFYVNSYSQNKDGGIVMVPKDHAFASPAIACKKGVVNMTSRIKAKYVGMKLILQALSEACLSGKTGK
ncbi:unnamed protein product [Allacma fusca]|uniref:SH2 domain-containing protein n=1 Tax=Allacma fusca TaxID=39272 RepID=A0A8J2KN93_9HEXA|nr:unnamed protein product [Allacma fusca]